MALCYHGPLESLFCPLYPVDIYIAMVAKLLRAEALANLILYSQVINILPEKVSSDVKNGSWNKL